MFGTIERQRLKGKTVVRTLTAVVLMGLLGASVAQASSWQGPSPGVNCAFNFDNKCHDHHFNTAAAPEIDPSAAVGALTLLAGGLAVVRGRRDKR